MVYLIPSILHEEGVDSIPPSVIEAFMKCDVFFVENERTARRYFKKLRKDMVIDNYEWFAIHKAEQEVREIFIQKLKEKKTIGIVSEAGSPGVADPGQMLVAVAHEHNTIVKPLAGPSSILLALMASGMNGQQFRFNGYLPVPAAERAAAIKALEAEARRTGCTQIFIETPYRNDQLLETILKNCHPATRLCIAADLTSSSEYIIALRIEQWRSQIPQLHKKLVVFLIGS